MTNPRVCLYQAEGQIYSISDFAKEHLNLVNTIEGEIILEHISQFPGLNSVPDLLQTPLTRSEWLKKSEAVIDANRGGGRSAYISQLETNIKACTPSEKGEIYTNGVLLFDESRISYQDEAFGVLSAENVMREILAVAFMYRHNIKVHQMPWCVYEYRKGEVSLGYGLPIRMASDQRIENLLDVKKVPDDKSNHQVGFKGIDFSWYALQKAQALIAFQLNGGIRNPANSNSGNDVVIFRDGIPSDFFITDFDTFKVRDMAKYPGAQFIKNFYYACFLELLVGSTAIHDESLSDIGSSDTQLVKSSKRWDALRRYSPLFRAYENQFTERTKEWDQEGIQAAHEIVLNDEEFDQALRARVATSKRAAILLSKSKPHMSHN